MTSLFPGPRRPLGSPPVPAMHAGAPVLELDRGSALRVLEGRASYGAGCDELVSLLADACVAPSPLELRGEKEALAAFRAAHASRSRLTLVPADAASAGGYGRRSARLRMTSRSGAPQVPARRVAPQVTATPVIGSVLAVAASAAVIVLAYTVSIGLPQVADPARQPVVSGRVEVSDPNSGSGSGTRPAAGSQVPDTAAAPGTSKPRTGGAVQSSVGTTEAAASGGAVAEPPRHDDTLIAGLPSGETASPSTSASPSAVERDGSSSAQGTDPSGAPKAVAGSGGGNGGGSAGHPPAKSSAQPPRGNAQPGSGGAVGTPRGNGPSEARTEDHASSQGHPGTTDDAPGGGRASTDEGGAADGKGKNVAPGRNDAPGKNGAPAKNDPSDKKAPSRRPPRTGTTPREPRWQPEPAVED